MPARTVASIRACMHLHALVICVPWQHRNTGLVYAFVDCLVTPAICWVAFRLVQGGPCSLTPPHVGVVAMQRFRPNPQHPRRPAQAAAAAGGTCLANGCRLLHVLIACALDGCACVASSHHDESRQRKKVSSMRPPKLPCLPSSRPVCTQGTRQMGKPTRWPLWWPSSLWSSQTAHRREQWGRGGMVGHH